MDHTNKIPAFLKSFSLPCFVPVGKRSPSEITFLFIKGTRCISRLSLSSGFRFSADPHTYPNNPVTTSLGNQATSHSFYIKPSFHNYQQLLTLFPKNSCYVALCVLVSSQARLYNVTFVLLLTSCVCCCLLCVWMWPSK